MSTNTALDEIKARAEINKYLGKTASQDEARDTLKLIAALEAVEALAEGWRDSRSRRDNLYGLRLGAAITEALR